MAKFVRVLCAVPAVVFAACLPSAGSSGKQDAGPSAYGDPSEEFTNALVLGVTSMSNSGQMPAGTTTGPQVTPPLSSTPQNVTPGFPLELAVPWTGGNITSLNIGFGGSRYFTVPVPPANASSSSGTVTIPANLMSSVCNNLANICHQIKCYEQVTTSAGTISKATAMQLVLNCTGGSDCNGNMPDAGSDGGGCGTGQFKCADGTCIPASSVCNSNYDCADGSDEDPNTCGNQGSCCIATNGCPGETGSSCANSCCCCPSAQACCPDPTQGCCASP